VCSWEDDIRVLRDVPTEALSECSHQIRGIGGRSMTGMPGNTPTVDVNIL
jgi:hypothetical protein